ncbi:MAG: hypothetical protein K8R74_13860 [Bacteroidales bacterium]|nr:hypothetical protein [Bacteroidales bacterium]
MEELLYRRQFILCPEEIDNRQGWNQFNIKGDYYLYVHPDLIQTEYTEPNQQIIILGDMYDPLNERFNNIDIAARLIKSKTIEELTANSSAYAGRFIIIFVKGDLFYMFNDASASRKIYYIYHKDYVWCASQPHVLADFCSIKESGDPQVQDFYRSREFKQHDHCGVLNNTIYDPIKQLLPNFYLDVKLKKIIRFWPVKKNIHISLQEGVEHGSKMLTGIIKSANERNDLMMAVTAGNDTRMLLAASRPVSENIFYYIINLPRYDEKSPDLVIPNKLLSKVGLKQNVLEFSNDIDEEFKKYYFLNNQFAHERNLSIIYSIFYKQFPDKINMPGRFSDIARNFFNTYHKVLTPELLATFWNYEDVDYVVDRYKIWLEEANKIKSDYNYRILELLNWEERNGNLYTQYQVDKDIAQEEFTPYNCRNLMEIYLAVPNKYRDIHTNVYFRAMIKHLWPELLTEPFNPKFEKRVSYNLKKIGIYWYIRRIIRGW